jgi:3-phosphoshikimate 1-carboxyvinyltransferase
VAQQFIDVPREAYVARPAGAITGTVVVPGDKSISHRALLLGAIAKGKTSITGFLRSDDCLATLAAIRSMGVAVADDGSDLTISGAGTDGFLPPSAPLDLGNSGTAMRLLLGVLSAQPFPATLTGDESLRSRPMERVAEPLREMGASIETNEGTAPVKVFGKRPLRAIDFTLPVASAQLKSAVLLAGLWANGRTTVRSPGTSRDHTERMLETFGILHRRRLAGRGRGSPDSGCGRESFALGSAGNSESDGRPDRAAE